jgi:hypothetical protein
LTYGEEAHVAASEEIYNLDYVRSFCSFVTIYTKFMLPLARYYPKVDIDGIDVSIFRESAS